MAELYKRLGTVASVTATNIATNGATASTWTIISSIVICNTSATAYTYTISTSSTSATHGAYIASAATVPGNDTVILVAGVCLDPTNQFLVANASNAAVNITAYGVTGP